MTLINNWTNSTGTLSPTTAAYVSAIGQDNYILTTGTQGDSPYYSNDGGSTWTAATVNDTWAGKTTMCLATVSSDSRIYLINQAIPKLYVSVDHGATYSVASSGNQYTCLTCVGSTLFATLETGTTLYKSTDHGVTFTAIATPDTTATAIFVAANSTCLFLCSTDTNTHLINMYRSQDSGTSWTQILTNYTIGFIGELFHTTNSTYLSIYDVPSNSILLLKSDDNFSTSTPITALSAIMPAPIVLGGADSSNDIYVVSFYTSGVLATSNDSGTSFVNEAPDSNGQVTLAIGDTSIVAITNSPSSGITAVYSGMLPGGIVKPNKPTISPATITNASPLTVTLETATTGAALYYTLDGTDPTESSTLYTSPFTLTYAVPTICTVKAIAVANSISSTVATQVYHIGNQVSAPVITGTLNTYGANMTITITDTTDGALIYYTDDGTTPTTTSAAYTEPFLTFESSIDIKAIAVKSGYFDSSIAESLINTGIAVSTYPTLGPYLNTYNCNPVASATRKFTIGTTAHIEMLSTTDGVHDQAPIYYTLDGSTPTIASTQYAAPLSITESCVVKAVSIKGVKTPTIGPVATITYTFTAGVLAKPTAYTLGAEYVDLTTGTHTTTTSDPGYVLTAVFIPDYNNGIGALATAEGTLGNVTPSYIYLCDPITYEPFKRLTQLDNGDNIRALAYSTDTGTLYAATENKNLYSIDLNTETITTLSVLLPNPIYYYLIYNNVDQCLYGYCSGSINSLVKYNTVTSTLSTITSNALYHVDFCDPITGTLYGHSGTGNNPGLFTIDPNTGVATEVITTTTSYDKVLHDNISGNTYALTYPGNAAVTAYTLDLAARTETLKFTAALTQGVQDTTIASTATVPAPLFSVAGGSYNIAQTVAITNRLTGINIYYTLDGTAPTANSTLYTEPLLVEYPLTLKAIATKSGFAQSYATVATYNISYTKVPKPILSVASGSFTNDQTVTLSDTKEGVTFYYTIDGTTPTTTSLLYTGPITISGNTTLQAIGIFEGLTNSDIVSATYTFSCITPTASIPAGTWGATKIITLSSETNNTKIYYTTDGTAPTQNSAIYSTPIHLVTTATLAFVATKHGYASTSVVTNVYTIIRGDLYYGSYNVKVVNTTNNVSAKLNSFYDGNMCAVAADGQSLYALGTAGLTTINPHTGEYTTVALSITDTIEGDSFVSATYYDNAIYACVSSGGSDSGVYKIDPKTYSVTLVRKHNYVQGITVYNEKIYFCTPYEAIKYMNLDGSNETVLNSSTSYMWGSLIVFNDYLYAGSYEYTNTSLTKVPGGIYKIDLTTGSIVSIINQELDRYWVGLAAGTDQLYARDSLTGIYRVNVHNNTVTQIVSEF